MSGIDFSREQWVDAAKSLNVPIEEGQTDQDLMKSIFRGIRTVTLERAAIERRLRRAEHLVGVRYAMGLVDQCDAILNSLERQTLDAKMNYKAMKDDVTGFMMGVQVLCNMVVNGNWTHSQKNNTIQALGELAQTAINRLRDESVERGYHYVSIYAPSWSTEGQYALREKAEKALEEKHKENARLRELLSEHGISAEDGDELPVREFDDTQF